MYAEQVEYLDDRIVQTVDSFVAASDRPVIVVVTGDHGPSSYEPLSEAGLRERMSILHAVKWVDGPPEGWHDAITPLRTMRLVTEEALGVSLGPLDDASYYSSYDRPYDLRLVDPRIGSPRATDD